MAVTTLDVVDPGEVPTIRRIRPRPLDLASVDPAEVVIGYDRRSDTLLVHFFGLGHASVSVQVAPYLSLLTDPDTEEIVGLHVEGYLAAAVGDSPEAIELLDHAELRGITREEVGELRRDLPNPRRGRTARSWWPASSKAHARKQRAIATFIAVGRDRWPELATAFPTPALAG